MTGRGSARRDVAEVSGRVGSSGRRRDGTRVSEPRTRRAFGRAWWWPRRADARARMKRSGRGTHPELLERVRLARTLPEERREIHAVALGLQIGDDPRGLLHVLGGCGIEERGGRAKAASEIGRAGIVRDVFALISRRRDAPEPPSSAGAFPDPNAPPPPCLWGEANIACPIARRVDPRRNGRRAQWRAIERRRTLFLSRRLCSADERRRLTANEHLVTRIASRTLKRTISHGKKHRLRNARFAKKCLFVMKWRLARHNDVRVVPRTPSSAMSLVNFGGEYVHVARDARSPGPDATRRVVARGVRPPREKSTAPSR